MSKIPLNITMYIDDSCEYDLIQKLDVLRRNERLSEFCSQAIKKALDDVDACGAINKKIELNGNGVLLDRKAFYDQVNKKLAYLEKQLDALRYDMHTAAVLADKAFYKELTVDVMATLDGLFQSIKNNVQIYPGEYIDTMRWKQRETDLQTQFANSLSNLRLIQTALSFEDEPDQNEVTQTITAEVHSEQLEQQGKQLAEHGEQLSSLTSSVAELLKGITDIKEVLLSSDIIVQQTGRTKTDTETPKETLPEYVAPPQEPVKYDAPPEQFSGDLSALTGFFGM